MDEKENEMKNSNEKYNRNRRSSILKPPKNPNDGNPTARRVSFSSNFIKTFTTDSDKNTIWDTTVEEPLSTGESSISRNKSGSEDHDMDTTLMCNLVDSSCENSDVQLGDESGQMKCEKISDAEKFTTEFNTTTNMDFTCFGSSITTSHEEPASKLDKSEDFTHLIKNCEVPVSEFDVLATMELTCVNSPLNKECGEPESKSNKSTTMEFTCINPPLDKNFELPQSKLNKSTTMEFTCINPPLNRNCGGLESKSNKSVTMDFTCINPLNKDCEFPQSKLNKSTTMEFTCINPPLNQNCGGLESNLNKSATMEFTCINPPLNKNCGGLESKLNKSTTMEFTCINPLDKNCGELESKLNKSATMEFTCINPPLNKNVEVPQSKLNKSTTMEFTCINPPLNKNCGELESKLNKSATMEFTCINPPLNKNVEVPQSKLNKSTRMEFTCINPLDKNCGELESKLNKSATMEFTCINPPLNKNVEVSQSKLNKSTTMEFTCINPPLNKNCGELESKLNKSATMEFTCINPPLNKNVEVPQSKLNKSTTMEFTCINPPLNKNCGELESKLNKSATMEFSCINPPLNKNVEVPQSKLNKSTTMEFTCINPPLNKNCGELESKLNKSATMEFTCINPPLNENCGELESKLNKSAIMEFTCINPPLNKNCGGLESKLNKSATMEFTCINPPLNKNCELPQSKQSKSTMMEFTCINPSLNKNCGGLESKLNKSATMDFTCLNPPLSRNCVGQESKLNKSATMEFTCINPPLKKNHEYSEGKLDHSISVEFTCINPSNKNCEVPELKQNISANMDLTCKNPQINNDEGTLSEHNNSTNIQFTSLMSPMIGKHEDIVTIPSENIPFDREASMQPKDLDTFDFTTKSNADKTNTSDISALNISKGISLIQNIPKYSPHEMSNFSIQSIKVDLPQLDLLERSKLEEKTVVISDPTEMWKEKGDDLSSMVTFTESNVSDCQHGEAVIQFEGNHVEQETSITVNEPHNSEFFTRNYINRTNTSNISTLDISKGISLINAAHSNSKHEFMNNSIQINEEQILDLPQLDSFKELHPGRETCISRTLENESINNLSSSKFVPRISIMNQKEVNPLHIEEDSCCEDLLLHVHTSKANAGDSKSGNVDLSNTVLFNIDDTQQLLKDASILNHTSYNNSSKIQINQTFTVGKNHSNLEQNNEINDELDYESLCDGDIRPISNKIDKEKEKQNCTPNEDMGNVNIELNEKHIENEDSFNMSKPESTEDQFMLEKSTIDLVESSADESLLSEITDQFVDKSEIKMSSYVEEQCSKTCRENDGLNTNSILQKDFTVSEFRILMQSNREKFVSKLMKGNIPKFERYHAPTTSVNELNTQIQQKEKSTMEKFEIFKKELDSVVEYCKNNKFVPDDFSDKDEDLYNESELKLPMKKGLLEEIKDKSERCDQSWKLIKVDNGIAEFVTFCDKIEIILEYSPKDNLVSSLTTRSLSADGSKPRGKLLEKEFLRLLSPAYMNNSIGSHYTILSLLDYLQIAMDKIKAFYTLLKDLEKSYGFKIDHEYIGKFTIIDTSLILKWDFTIDLSNLDNINKNCVVILADIGKVDTRDVLNMVEECPKGLEFLTTYITKVKEYLEVLKNRRRLVRTKNNR